MSRTARVSAWSSIVALASLGLAQAHHSYAMFDLTRRAEVSGTVAKLEWTNPHVFLWVYVKNATGKHDLYAFESGSISILTRHGWTRDTLKAGDAIAVEYFPLKDGRAGGYYARSRSADGRVLNGDPFAPGGERPLFGPPASAAPRS